MACRILRGVVSIFTGKVVILLLGALITPIALP